MLGYLLRNAVSMYVGHLCQLLFDVLVKSREYTIFNKFLSDSKVAKKIVTFLPSLNF